MPYLIKLILFSEQEKDKFRKWATPFFYYDLNLLGQTLESINKEIEGLPYKVHYAIKANTNPIILKEIKKYHLGIDCVSGNEVKHAIKEGFEPKHIAFAGVGKTDEEIIFDLENKIFTFNVESIAELKVINEIAESLNKKAPIAIRFNPNVNAKTHKYITTGLEENKFGLNYWELDSLFQLLEELKFIQLKGIHFHIGSQITDLSVYQSLCNRVNELQKIFLDRGYSLDHINVGGGLGVDYNNPDENSIPNFKDFFSIFKNFIELQEGQSLHFELGRAIVAQCGSLISKALYVKEGIKTNFLIIDAGMTELIRPALYQSFHKIENITSNSKERVKYDVVGPICESSDCFGKEVDLPLSERGDLIALRTTGAYGEVMSSSYNLREKAKAYYNEDI